MQARSLSTPRASPARYISSWRGRQRRWAWVLACARACACACIHALVCVCVCLRVGRCDCMCAHAARLVAPMPPPPPINQLLLACLPCIRSGTLTRGWPCPPLWRSPRFGSTSEWLGELATLLCALLAPHSQERGSWKSWAKGPLLHCPTLLSWWLCRRACRPSCSMLCCVTLLLLLWLVPLNSAALIINRFNFPPLVQVSAREAECRHKRWVHAGGTSISSGSCSMILTTCAKGRGLTQY